MKKIYFYTFSLLFLVVVTGCDTWEKDINSDPNVPSVSALSGEDSDEADPSDFMLDMIWNTVHGWDYIAWNVGAAVCEYHGKTLSLSQGNRHQAWHAFDDGGGGGPWPNCYTTVRYIKKMKKLAKATGSTNYEAIANIWECYTFFGLTLLYGDIPYSETMQDDAPIDPVYDSQEEIYFTLMQKLKAAGESIDATSNVNANTDLIFEGNMEMWKKFANTLLIRYAMYLSDADLDSTKAYLQTIIDDPSDYPVMESNDDNAAFHYDGTEYQSKCYSLSASKIAEAPFSNVFIERLVSLQDPRLPLYARPVEKVHTDPLLNVLPSNSGASKYAGHIYGITTDNAYSSAWNDGANYASKLGEYFRTEDDKGAATIECAKQPFMLATYAEMNFFLAEAAQNGWLTSGKTAKEYYETAVNASFDQYGASFSSNAYQSAFTGNGVPQSTDDYLDQPEVNFDGGRNPLVLIAEQKWIADFWLSFETYFDHRRTMLPAWRASSGAAAYNTTGSGTRFPSRAAYPSDEEATNATNVAKAKAIGFSEAIVGQSNRNNVFMWLLQNKDKDWLQMPVFQEPSYKSEYPAKSNDAEYGTAFYSWYTNNWNSMFWWKNNDD